MARRIVYDAKTSLKFASGGSVNAINLGNSSTLNRSDQFSVSMWFKHTAELAAANTYLMARASAWYIRRTAGANNIQVGIYNQVPTQIATTAYTLPDNGVWHHLVVTCTTTVVKYYLDGQLIQSPAMTATSFTQNSNPTIIGGWDGTTAGFNYEGNLEEVRYYSSVLTQDEVTKLYNNNIVPKGCVGEWLLNEGSGTTATDTVGTNNGTISGATWSTDVPTKPRLKTRNYTSSLNFNGSSAFVNCGTGTDNTIANLSLACWVYLPKRGATNSTFMAKDSNSGGRSWVFRAATTNQLAFEVDGTGTFLQSSEVLPFGQWIEVVLTAGNVSGANQDYVMYVNGKIFASGTKPKITANSTNGLYFGKRNYTGAEDYLTGNLADCRMWNRTLSATEVSNMYYNGTVPTTGLTGRWLISGDSGTTITDSSGYGNTGTITAATFSSNIPMPLRLKTRNYISSLKFDGSTNTCVTTNTAATQLSTGTISIWFNPTATNSSYRVLMAKNNAYGVFLKDDTLIIYDWGGTSDRTTSIKPSKNNWHMATVTFQSGVTNGTTVYLDGLPVLTTTMTVSNQNTALVFGNTSGQCLTGNLVEARLWNKVLSASEVANLYYSNSIDRSTLVGEWLISGNAGTSVLDTSGNSNTATVSGATFSSNTPFTTRKLVNGNLVNNGYFSDIPNLYTPQTANAWIDGTASGSTTNPPIYKWRKYSSSVAQTCNFTSSNELQLTNAGGLSAYCWVGSDRNVALSAPTYTTMMENDIKVTPNTSYTLTVRAKADFTPATGQISVNATTNSGDGTDLTFNSASYNSITSDYQIFTKTFTTDATAQWISIVIKNGIVGVTAVAGTLTIDYIELKPTN